MTDNCSAKFVIFDVAPDKGKYFELLTKKWLETNWIEFLIFREKIGYGLPEWRYLKQQYE